MAVAKEAKHYTLDYYFDGMVNFKTPFQLAPVLEQHGFPPLLMGLESVDMLDHVIFIYRQRGRWGSVPGASCSGMCSATGACPWPPCVPVSTLSYRKAPHRD